MIKQLVISVSLIFLGQNSLLGVDAHEEFLKSFIGFYEMHKEGRYTHEYHPYLLKKAAQSFDQLEARLRADGFNLPHRMVIMGYEGQAAPNYFFDPQILKGGAINDEVFGMSVCGVAQPAHNMFGLMTGFLLRKTNAAQQRAVFPMMHVRPHAISLFDERASIFQADAFGSLYAMIRASEVRVLERLSAGTQASFMQELINFWREIYAHAVLTGAQQVAGTQDILFTIEHAHHIKRSEVPLKMFCTGADITYPITQTTRMLPQATVNAQAFVKKFVKNLVPVNNQKTVYIFRSFVDGVGKSTMLGNVKNWCMHGDAVEKYEAVDNTSSQFVEVFQYDDDVFIGDLPAQLSHFTYKPDGDVFVDVRATVADELAYAALSVRLKRDLYEAECVYRSLLKKYTGCSLAALLTTDTDTPDHAYAKNMVLLNKQHDRTWIPVWEGTDFYLVNRTTDEIRMCKPIVLAHSEGLKNADPEQMLFRKGLRFPMPYQKFLDDLSAQCMRHGIQQVVFVDFLSMYSRSSRENVRINYLIQQLKHVHASGDYQQSLYRSMVTNAELYCQLKDPVRAEQVRQYLIHEALLRAGLFEIVQKEDFGDVEAVSLPRVTEVIQSLIDDFKHRYYDYAKNIVDMRIKSEFSKLDTVYRSNKEVVHILESEPRDLYDLSRAIEHHMAALSFSYTNPWDGFGDIVEEDDDVVQGACDRVVAVSNGEPMRALAVINPQERHLKHVAHVYQLVRKWWYPTLIGALRAAGTEGEWRCEKNLLQTAPVIVRFGRNGYLYVLQKILTPLSTRVQYTRAEDINARNPYSIVWGAWGETSLIMDWDCADTYTGMYGYCYTPFRLREHKGYPFWMDYAANEAIVKVLAHKRVDEVVSVREVIDELHKNPQGLWPYVRREQKDFIKRSSGRASREPASQKKTKLTMLKSEEAECAQHAIYLLAVLDMVAHDARAPIAVRRQNVQDFVAAMKLISEGVAAQYGETYIPQDYLDTRQRLPDFLNFARTH